MLSQHQGRVVVEADSSGVISVISLKYAGQMKVENVGVYHCIIVCSSGTLCSDIRDHFTIIVI